MVFLKMLQICKNKKIITNLEISLNKKIINIALKNKPNFIKITKAGFYESMVHNVDEVTKDNKY